MKSLVTLVVVLVFVLSACVKNNSKPNTFSAVELSEKEHAIITTTSDKSFTF